MARAEEHTGRRAGEQAKGGLTRPSGACHTGPGAARMRTENLAVMLTDMKGFTAATSRQTRAENAHMLGLQDVLLLPVVRAFGGCRVKTIGDAYLVLFASPTSAVLCGMALQDRLWEYDRRAPELDRIEVRVVVSLGEVRLEGPPGAPTDVYGEAVNLASRVEAEAEAGEIWFTEAVRLVADRAEFAQEEIGFRALKGLPEEVRLYRVARTGGAAAAPYGGSALARVAGLVPAEPGRLARELRRREQPFHRAAGALREAVAGLTARGAAVAALLALAAAGAWGAALWAGGGTERLIRAGRWEAARAAIEARAAGEGAEDPEVLYLRGRLEAARADAGEDATLKEALHLWSRALARGSGAALDALAEATTSPGCAQRRLAARALAEARTPRAQGVLEDLARAEPAPADALERVKGLLGGRCGAGDLAREGLRALAERR